MDQFLMHMQIDNNANNGNARYVVKQPHRNIGAIVGGAVGGVAAVALAVAAFLLWRRGDPELRSTGQVFAVVQSEEKQSLDSMRPHNADTVPTPFGSDWQAIYHATHFGEDTSTNSSQQPILPASRKRPGSSDKKS